MKKLIKKEYRYLFIFSFLLLFFVHFSLIYKNIVSADILLNNYYYNGYSWEVSLGRFGLFFIGIIKSYLNVPFFDLIISYILISISNILIIDLFKIKNKINRIFLIIIIGVSPIISSTLLFNYCSIGYSFAFLFSILSLYIFVNNKNIYIKYLVPICLLVISLSMYQAYLSLIVSIFIIYFIKLIIDNRVDYKYLKYLLCILISIIIYFLLMKLSLVIFNIDIASYSNANKIGISTLLSFPNKILESYKLFYNYYFTNKIMKNTYMHNNIINMILLLLIVVNIIIGIIKKKISKKNIIFLLIIVLLLPVFLNSVIFVVNDSKLQLLMAASYLTIPILLFSFNFNYKYLIYILLVLLIRNHFIQIQSTYLTLENTFNTYDSIIMGVINNNINNPNKSFIIIGDLKNDSEISKMNYGFISDDGLFWNEYNLRKIGFEKFVLEYHGLKLKYGNEDDYKESLAIKNDDLYYNNDDVIIINLNNYKKKRA